MGCAPPLNRRRTSAFPEAMPQFPRALNHVSFGPSERARKRLRGHAGHCTEGPPTREQNAPAVNFAAFNHFDHSRSPPPRHARPTHRDAHALFQPPRRSHLFPPLSLALKRLFPCPTDFPHSGPPLTPAPSAVLRPRSSPPVQKSSPLCRPSPPALPSS